MWGLVGNAIIRFMGTKQTSFPNAIRSKELLLAVPDWKRVMIFVRMIRHVLDTHASKHWNKYGYENWKFSYRAFRNWMTVDQQVLAACPVWDNIPDKLSSMCNLVDTTSNKKKRKRVKQEFDISSPDEKRKVYFDCTLSSDEDA